MSGRVGGDGHGGLYGTSGTGGWGSASSTQPAGSSDPHQDPDDPRRHKGLRGCLQIVAAFGALVGLWWAVGALMRLAGWVG